MNKQKFKELIKETLLEYISNDTPTIKPFSPVTKPGTPLKPKIRRPLTPPSPAPSTRPAKAEKQLVDKISQRFSKLKNKNEINRLQELAGINNRLKINEVKIINK